MHALLSVHRLEAVIGAPNPEVGVAMEDEHTGSADSDRQFTTDNYGVTTTSKLEWEFVACPDDMSAPAPIESKLLLRARRLSQDGTRWPRMASKAQCRRPMSRKELEGVMGHLNQELQKLDEQTLQIEEAMASRLYTGPMYVKYNTVLRGRGADAPKALKEKMEELCGPTDALDMNQEAFEGSAKTTQLNLYTTTLHAINSAIVKLSKLTTVGKVYRGIAGRVLPEQFWKPNKFGVRGGIETGFTSTTRDRDVALQYASTAGAGFIFEIQMGMIE